MLFFLYSLLIFVFTLLSLFLFLFFSFFFFNDTATTEIYTLSLHDALPIWIDDPDLLARVVDEHLVAGRVMLRSEEHTSELQSRFDLVCRLLLEKKKKKKKKKSYNKKKHKKNNL